MALLTYTIPNSMTQHSVVFDLDETLVHTLSIGGDEAKALALSESLGIYSNPQLMDIRSRSFRLSVDDPVTPRGTGQKYACWGVIRPHLEEFLIFAFAYFKTVSIWSAGCRSYVEETARFLEKKAPGKFKLIYTRDQCLKQDNNHYKPLQKMLQEHPEIGTLEHTFIVDDRADTFMFNPQNGVLIPEYRRENPTINTLRMDDDNLLRFKYWLLNDKVKNSTDIRTLNKSTIFHYSVADYLKGRGDF